MRENVKFYRCPICGNIIELIEGNITNIICCGKEMEQMIANNTDASIEKHVPVYEKVDNEIIVKIGEVEHPMEKDHYIMWIIQVSENKITKVILSPNESTETKFSYIKGSTIYAYCNKHGLWKKIVE